MTFRQAMEFGTNLLKESGISDAKNDAWLLLSMIGKIDHTYYYVHMEEELEPDVISEYERVLRKRAEHIPLQYITGEQEFMGLNFHVNSSVLIPRQDTETLVEQALKVVRPGMKVLDLCTGSGCVLISILKNVTGVTGLGTDISKQALLVAKENAKLNHVTAEFERSDLFDSISETFDVIVSNPPYIPTAAIHTLMPEVAQFEPYQALDGKEDGLYFYRRIMQECRDYLNPDGKILLEIGHDQGDAVSAMLRLMEFQHVRVVKDLAGNDRVVVGGLQLWK
uniref:peptide chain release factor N(5)-glutamine methyltransferase n=1 Tax=Agathobacter sp. TaxID=2021311 RepID=UPI0040563E47